MYYASGAQYDGQWVDNIKHGSATYTFQNGFVYRCEFLMDHMSDPPPAGKDDILLDLRGLGDESNDPVEVAELLHVVRRHWSDILRVYKAYSQLGVVSPENVFVLNRLQLHRLFKDSGVERLGISCCEVDRAIAPVCTDWTLHGINDTILPRHFYVVLIRVSHLLFATEEQRKGHRLADCLTRLIEGYIVGAHATQHGFLFRHAALANGVAPYFNQVIALSPLAFQFRIHCNLKVDFVAFIG